MIVKDRVLIFTLSMALWGGLLGITLVTGHVLAMKQVQAGHAAPPAAGAPAAAHAAPAAEPAPAK